MSDYGLFITPEGLIDIKFSLGDVVPDDGLETAVLISLFSDARATDDMLAAIDRDGDLRGYWGDVPGTAENGPIGDSTGSLLWVIKRAKQLNQTRADAQFYARQSLQWLIDDGIASSVRVETSYPTRGVMLLDIAIYRPQSANPVVFRYNYEWNAQIIKVAN